MYTQANKETIVTTSWDDGHKLDLRLAELLKKYGLKGTFYIAPKNRELKKEQLLTPSEISQIYKDFEIGAHTITHPVLTEISSNEALYEVTESKKYLENLLNDQVKCFCYPRGVFNKEIKKIVKNAGFIGARTIEQMSIIRANDTYEFGTSIQPFVISYSIISGVVKFALSKDFKILPYVFLPNKRLAKTVFDYVKKNGGIYHLWGHSWEIEKYNKWEEMEHIFSYISKKPNVKYLNNSEMLEEYE